VGAHFEHGDDSPVTPPDHDVESTELPSPPIQEITVTYTPEAPPPPEGKRMHQRRPAPPVPASPEVPDAESPQSPSPPSPERAP